MNSIFLKYAVLFIVLISASSLSIARQYEIFELSDTTKIQGKSKCFLSNEKNYNSTSDNILRFRGQYSRDGCVATITKRSFENVFEFCYLAGFRTVNIANTEYSQCDIEPINNNWIFRADIGKDLLDRNGSLTCKFICKRLSRN